MTRCHVAVVRGQSVRVGWGKNEAFANEVSKSTCPRYVFD
jgi:hypothetical protein